ncbi:MAG: exodeoxyribonuclease III [Myxococcales bacterium]|nr:exodeoxyribonuclease III [Myxococcales bacterium]
MRVAAWNINSITARLDFVLDFLRTHEPDAVCIQELKVTDEAFPQLAFAGAGYHALTYGQAQWNGVAVLVKQSADPSPRIVHRGLPGQEAMGARLVTVHALDLSLTSVYVPNGKSLKHPDYQAKLAWLDDLVAHAGSLRTGASIIAGDFNLCPGDLDSWDPVGHTGHIFHTDAERERFQRLLDLGFVDLFRAQHPDLQSFSWWDYRAGCFHKKQGLRIDFVLGTPAVRARMKGASIERDFRKKREGRIPSDHAPVIIDLE